MRRTKKSRGPAAGRRAAGARAVDRSRRRFLELLAAGSAAVLTRPAAALAADPKAADPGAERPAGGARRNRASLAEIEKQKRDLATSLRAIRDFRLPPGSDPAFVFIPLRARRSRGGGQP